MRGFYVVKNPLVRPSFTINEGGSTIERFTIEGFQCICEWSAVLAPLLGIPLTVIVVVDCN